MAVPRVVDGIGEKIVGTTGGWHHSLVITAEGHVLAFGGNGEEDQEYDSDAGELGEPFFAVNGRLGLAAGVEEALTPTAIDGIAVRKEGEEGLEGKEGKE